MWHGSSWGHRVCDAPSQVHVVQQIDDYLHISADKTIAKLSVPSALADGCAQLQYCVLHGSRRDQLQRPHMQLTTYWNSSESRTSWRSPARLVPVEDGLPERQTLEFFSRFFLILFDS